MTRREYDTTSGLPCGMPGLLLTVGMAHQPDTSVLLLCESEQSAALDKRALREVGVSRLSVMTSGLQAAGFLAQNAANHGNLPDIIVCSAKLADMDGERFCIILRLHPRFEDMPVLLILPSAEEMEQCKILGSEANTLLGRPYSAEELKKNLVVLAAMGRRAAVAQQNAPSTDSKDTKEFDVALSTGGLLLKPVMQTEDYLHVGMQFLRNARWNEALNAFRRAAHSASGGVHSDSQNRGDAALGMAAAWKGKRDTGRHLAALTQAADAFVDAENWPRARAVYANLRKLNPAPKNPFLTRARQLMRQSLYSEAAKTLAEGYDVTSGDQVKEQFAQTCLAAQKPEDMAQGMACALASVLGDRGERLAEGMRHTLDELISQREIRRRQAALERQETMSRVAAPQAKSAAAHPVEAAAENTALRGSVADLSNVPSFGDVDEDDDLLEGLPDGAAIGAFSAPSGSSDVISVIKCTWKLFRSGV